MLNPRERILSAAYPLFAERGLRGVSEESIREAAGVTQQELTSAFPSTEALAAACVVYREREWTIAVTEAAARSRGTDPESRLLAVFDVLEEWFQSEEEEAIPFLEVLIDLGRDNRQGRPDVAHLAHVRAALARLGREASLREPEAFALSFHVLLKACILSALEGDTLGGVRARELGRELIVRHRQVPREPVATPGATWFGDPSFDLYESEGPRPVAATSFLDWYDDASFEDRLGD
ncbi:TetR/AcrR family transcriptional regulator [Naasia sp. SYSU D00948]|uniref:TetR/AcrR family transcriptional regulator n=1 Tax=Naasia sp. SYSU D00948 TaxID=2817379 RepID=UPI001B313605|nr:TetR/AcrR family transcriptional regulator [Naasia sp. SYSU D00948]